MKLIWKGPPTAVEVYPATPADTSQPAAPLFSGPVAEGMTLDLADADETHPQVASWLAFSLAEKAPAAEDALPVAEEAPARRLKITKIEEA